MHWCQGRLSIFPEAVSRQLLTIREMVSISGCRDREVAPTREKKSFELKEKFVIMV